MRKELLENYTVYVYCDSSVTADEREMLVKAMESAAPIFGCCFMFSGSGGFEVPGGGRLKKSVDEMVAAAALNDKGQISAKDMLDMASEVFGKMARKGALIVFTSRDLFLKESWCFGAARVGGSVSVQSMARFRQLEPEVKQAVITRTLRHELGHIHRLAADPDRACTENKYGRHCTRSGCTMRQSVKLSILIEHAREEDPKNCLCDLCRADLERFKRKNY